MDEGLCRHVNLNLAGNLTEVAYMLCDQCSEEWNAVFVLYFHIKIYKFFLMISKLSRPCRYQVSIILVLLLQFIHYCNCMSMP